MYIFFLNIKYFNTYRRERRYTNTAKKNAIFFMDGIRKKLIGNLYKQPIWRVLNLHTQLVSLELTIPYLHCFYERKRKEVSF